MTTTRHSTEKETEVLRLTEHLFRHEAGRLVSVLTGIFGLHRLQMAEDVVQEAMARALKTWVYYGVPENPPAWLMQTAKHLALDIVRREKRFREKQSAVMTYLEQRMPDAGLADGPLLEGELRDDRLRLMFACCHPHLPQAMQIGLALKTLCGFSPAEISKAFLTTEAAIIKRLTRARQRLQADHIRFEIPAGPELAPRLEGVLRTLYLLFNEGYKASSGDRFVREELCAEAIRLAGILAEHPAGGQPQVHALLALMLLNAARLPARTDPDGNFVRMEHQDRSRWDRSMIQRGIYHLGRSAGGATLNEYHLQAGIAACHCLAVSDADTDWKRILSLYDHLLEIDDSPVVALNQAVAAAKVYGAAEGIARLEGILERNALSDYYLAHAVLGDLERQRENPSAAACHFAKALKMTEVKAERELISQRLRECAAL